MKKLINFFSSNFFLSATIVIFLVSVFFKFYELEQRSVFGWDQERDAMVVWSIIKDFDLTLIGPRVFGPDSFFLGPLWYYLLVPVYLIFNMDPIAGAYFTSTIGLITALVFLIVIKKIFGQAEGFMIALVFATISDRIPWNPILIPLLVVLLIFSLEKVIQGQPRVIIFSTLILVVGLQIHFQAVFFIPAILLSLIFFYKTYKYIPKKELLVSSLFFLLSFAPLIIFDFRNGFINLNAFIKFFQHPPGVNNLNYLDQIFFIFSKFSQGVNIFFSNNILPQVSFSTSVLIISILGFYFCTKPKILKQVLVLLLLTPMLTFIFYRGMLSEYYLLISYIMVTLGLVLFLARFKKILLINILVLFLLIFFTQSRLAQFLTTHTSFNLANKRAAVSYIVSQKEDLIFNVSYSVPVNEDKGFSYLFKYLGKEPQNIPEAHLWTIVIPPDRENVPPRVVFGDIGVIRR